MPQEDVVRLIRQFRRDLEAAHGVSARPSRDTAMDHVDFIIILKSSPEHGSQIRCRRIQN